MHTPTLALALAGLAQLSYAQTFSDCDPTAGDKCEPNPAFANCNKATTFDFSTLPHGESAWKDDDKFNEFWEAAKSVKGKQLSIDDDGMALRIDNGKDSGPLIKSNQYLFYGSVEVEVRAAPGVGVVTSVVLESNDRDEIDWEWLGGDPGHVQTNFFSKGANEFVNGGHHPITFNAVEGLHKYTIDWTPEYIAFLVDGEEVRRAVPGDPKKWPQTPMQVKLGTWVGGLEGGDEGTIEWAGGVTDFSEAPFVAWYKSVKITDSCGGENDAKEYVWTDDSGDSDSIDVVGGSGKDKKDDDEKNKSDEDKDKDDKDKDKDDDDDDDEESSSAEKTTVSKTSSKETSSSTSTADSADETDADGESSGDADGDDADTAGQEDGGDSAASMPAFSATLAAVVGLGYLILA